MKKKKHCYHLIDNNNKEKIDFDTTTSKCDTILRNAVFTYRSTQIKTTFVGLKFLKLISLMDYYFQS